MIFQIRQLFAEGQILRGSMVSFQKHSFWRILLQQKYYRPRLLREIQLLLNALKVYKLFYTFLECKYILQNQSKVKMSEKIDQFNQKIQVSPDIKAAEAQEQQITTQNEKQLDEPVEIKSQEPDAQKLIEQNEALAEVHKGEGSEHFKSKDYQQAISAYQQALRYAPLAQTKLRSILYSNIAICLIKQDDHKDAIQYLKKSIKNDPSYLKAHLNLALTYEKIDNPQQALVEYKKVIQLTPYDIKSQLKVKQLERVVEELNEKRKKEVLDGLKTIGNSVLGFFGLSLDNFKLNQSDGGGYNVSFKN